MSSGKRVLLIISGGIAAYKSLELIRELRTLNIDVRCILTKAGGKFVTPLSLQTLTENKVYDDLFSLTDECEMGHIELSRDADLIVIAPATANIIAKMSAGICDDLATTAVIATNKPVLVAPSMNVRMWEHPATQSNILEIKKRGVHVIGPETGDMACGEYGVGRMSEPSSISEKVCVILQNGDDLYTNKVIPKNARNKLLGLKAIVTSGPTNEAIDPIRYITNHSSGQQGHAIARALSEQGAETTLISGPTQLSEPEGVTVKHIKSATEMLEACEECLPADIVVCAAAVADWRVSNLQKNKIKKNGVLPNIELIENPDILMHISQLSEGRPQIVIGFAAETENLITNAKTKLSKKGCDWIVANDVSSKAGVFGGEHNTVHIISKDGVDTWPTLTKFAIGQKLSLQIADFLENLS
jgi:phosphopantothenoylcysteine decarboxylase/phosphopantothenate--cysteine ligase